MTARNTALRSLGSIGLIGVGAVGAALARSLVKRGAHVTHVAARRHEHATALARRLPGVVEAATPTIVAESCNLVFLAVPDDAIAELSQALPWHEGQGITHLSGARDASVLAPVTARGAHPAALHPLMTFPSSSLDEPISITLERFAGCVWALEAPNDALRHALEIVVSALDGDTIHLEANDRIPYHLAGVFASNYVATLLGAAASLWEGFGVDGETALHALLPLLRGTLDNLSHVGLPQALSGPLARGDVGTLAAHLAWLDEHAAAHPDVAALRDAYVALAKLALPIARAKGTLTPAAEEQLRQLFPLDTPAP